MEKSPIPKVYSWENHLFLWGISHCQGLITAGSIYNFHATLADWLDPNFLNDFINHLHAGLG